MYVDLETGTIVNGPVVWINVHDESIPPMPEDASDSAVIEWADENGVPIEVPSPCDECGGPPGLHFLSCSIWK